MCNELGIKFGRCIDDTKAILAKQGITELATAQLKDATDKVEDELHAIMFIYKTDRARYGSISKRKKTIYWKEMIHSPRQLQMHAEY